MTTDKELVEYGRRGGVSRERDRRMEEKLLAIKRGEHIRVSNKARCQARRLCRLHLALRDRYE